MTTQLNEELIVPVKFYHRSGRPPESGRRIYVYSPCYENGDQTMLYRLMDSQFLSITKDAEYWAYADQIKPQVDGGE